MIVILMHWRDWDKRLSIFLHTYKALSHKIAGMMSTSMVFRRKLHLPCNLLFSAALDKKSVTCYMADLVDQLHNIHH
jgi:hypothetical protein